MGRLVGGTPEESERASQMGHEEPAREGIGTLADFVRDCQALSRDVSRVWDEVRLGHRRLTQVSDGTWYRYDERTGKLQPVEVVVALSTFGGTTHFIKP